MQLIMEALDAMTHHNEFCSVDGHESLSRKIVALHLIHGQWSAEVMQFSQLVLNRPGILHSLSEMNSLARAGKEVCVLKISLFDSGLLMSINYCRRLLFTCVLYKEC